MKKALLLGIIGSFFFAFTFILNRSMHLSGGSWIYSASLRYIFTLPLMALILWKGKGFTNIHSEIKANPKYWILWSFVGFFLFYAPLSFAGDNGESWLIAASWQITILMGILLTPVFGKKMPLKNLGISMLILLGVIMVQFQSTGDLEHSHLVFTLLPILVAAASYPLGNRKIMQICHNEISTQERVYGMTLCSIPFWIILFSYGVVTQDLPGTSQIIQSFCVALFSGVLATLFFFRATDLVKHNQRQLAVIESTQSGEVIFTLLGGIIFLGDALPDAVGFAGILLIIVGMMWNSKVSGS